MVPKQKRTFAFLVSLFFCACAQSHPNSPAPENETGEEESSSLAAPGLTQTNFMTGLSSPWDLAWTNDGHLFFTEKCRGLSVRKPNGSITRLFGTSGSALMASDLFCQGQSGMQGVALDPQFASNRFIYVFMSSSRSSPRTNRVIRLTVNTTSTSVSNRVDIVTDIPYKNADNSWGGAGSHSGGRLRFGPDGFLYIGTGDNHRGPLPQNLRRLGGKVLRIDRNGTAAPGNNTPSGGDPRIYTYGHRNVQGLAFRPSSGRVFIAEHGPGHSDEVTALTAGANGGWDPVPDSGVTCADNYCGYISNKADGTPTPMTDLDKFPQAMRPTWKLSDSSGMGPCTFLTGAQWKSWDGALIVATMSSQKLHVLQLGSDQTVVAKTTAALPSTRMRSLVQGPDGNLYVATDGGQIWKVTPQ